jgi:hypothetical protein
MRRTVIATLVLAVAGFAGSASAQTVKSGTISADETWGAAPNPCPIILDGPVVVGDGIDDAAAGDFNNKVTLTILPGCVVRGQGRTAAGAAGAPGSLTVSRSGRLVANGNASPTGVIIFTTAATDNDADGNPDRTAGFLEPWDPGDLFWDDAPQSLPKAPLAADGTSNVQLWGGLIVLGNAPVNIGTGCATGVEGVCNVEGLELPGLVTLDQATYGGTQAHDSSGSMSYLSVRHGGDEVGTANEINGITLGGVGLGTEFNYIEVYANFDDGIEWFGGTVNGSHLVITLVGDDMWDSDQGYTGVNQFLFGVMPWFGEADGQPDIPGPPPIPVGLYGSASGDKAGEWDGDDFNEAGGASVNCLPKSNAHFYNMTAFGSGQVTSPDFTPAATDVAGVADNRGVQMRNGFGGALFNSIVANTIGNGVDIDTNLADGCPGNSTTEQIAVCSTKVIATTQSNVPVPAGDELAVLACGDADARVDCGVLGCNVVNPAAFAFSIVNADTSFDPQGDANGDLVASLKTAPINPETTGFTGTVGGMVPPNGNLLDRTATYRGAFDSSLTTLWVDDWTVLSIAGLVDN